MASRKPRNDAAGRDEGEKITDGLNDRPRNATIAQTGGGVPNDSSKSIEADPAEEKRISDKLRSS